MEGHGAVPRHYQLHYHVAEPIRWWKIFSIWMTSVGESSQDNGRTQAQTDEAKVQAFYELFSRYQKPIADFLYRMTHDRDWAADLTQDTFLKAFAHANDLPSNVNVRAWLYRIAANTAHNAIRHQRRFTWVSLSEMRPGDSSDPRPGVTLVASGDLATNVVERDTLLRALDVLSPIARTVILLRSTAGFDVTEIATMMGLTEVNTRKILYRAKEKLRQALTTGIDTDREH